MYTRSWPVPANSLIASAPTRSVCAPQNRIHHREATAQLRLETVNQQLLEPTGKPFEGARNPKNFVVFSSETCFLAVV